MIYEVIVLLQVLVFFFAPILSKGKWFLLLSVGILTVIIYQQVEMYQYRHDMSNKYGPGHMLGDIVLTYIHCLFFVGLAIKAVLSAVRKINAWKENNKHLQPNTD